MDTTQERQNLHTNNRNNLQDQTKFGGGMALRALGLEGQTMFRDNITEEEFRDALNKIGAYRTNMSQKRRENWNAYMRKYNARKKAEREKRDKEISLQFNKSYKSYDKEDVNKCLTDCISTLTAVLNINIERIPQYRIDQINTKANNRDVGIY